MAQITFEEALNVVRSLPHDDRRRLLKAITQEYRPAERAASDERDVTQVIKSKTYEAEYRWLREHAAEYAGQWVALEGDRLLSHGVDMREVHRTARSGGAQFPYLVQVEADAELPFGGW